jgi:hypothetical protein
VRGAELVGAVRALTVDHGGRQAAVFLVLLCLVCLALLFRRISAPTRV